MPDDKLINLIIYLPNRKATNFNSIDAMHSYNNGAGRHLRDSAGI